VGPAVRRVVSLGGTRTACLLQHGVQGRLGIGRLVHYRSGRPSHGDNANVIETAAREDPARPHRGRWHAKDLRPPPIRLVAPVGHPTSLPGRTARRRTTERIAAGRYVAPRALAACG
jgi:hypothetical protein